MAGLELNLIAHLLDGNGKRIESCMISPAILPELIGKSLEYIRAYYAQYKNIPHRSTIYKELGLQVPESEGDYEYCVKEIQDQHFHQKSRRHVEQLARCLQTKDYESFRKLGLQSPSLIESWTFGQKEVVEFFDAQSGLEMWEGYLENKQGIFGIPTPWESLTNNTLGWQKGDFVLVGARPGTGKTFLVLHLARHAWSNKYRVLIISPEMKAKSLRQRMAAVHLKLNYDHIRKGLLSSGQEQIYREFLFNLSEEFKDRLFLLSDDFSLDIQAVERAIILNQPDIVFIDGVYLLKDKTIKDKHDRASYTADWIKMSAKKYGIPFFCTTQLNREASKLKFREITTAHFVLSDAYGWNIDFGFAFGADEAESNRVMLLRSLKTREGGTFSDLKINWDYKTHNFTEFTGPSSYVEKEKIPY